MRCTLDYERKMTRAEKEFFEMDTARGEKRTSAEYAVWWSFQKSFMKKDDSWRVIGYKLMERVERWAKKQPKDFVRIVSVDDAYFSTSLLVLIEHKTDDSYMGTSVVFIPQCTGENPIRFFLYPEFELLKVLKEIEKSRSVVAKAQEERRKKEHAEMMASVTLPSEKELSRAKRA